MLPKDWQDVMIEMIRGAKELDGAWFAGSHALTGEEQIAIYRSQYRLRMSEAMLEEIPGFQALVGDDTEEIMWRYLDECPPHSWTLVHITDRFSDWLQANSAPVQQVEMARLDWEVMRVFEAADGVIPSPEDVQKCMAGEPLRITLQPHVRLLKLSHTVHAFRSAVLSDLDAQPVRESERHLVIYRADRRVRHVELDVAEHAILSSIDAGGSLEVALEEGYRASDEDEAYAQNLSGWFSNFVSRGLIEFERG